MFHLLIAQYLIYTLQVGSGSLYHSVCLCFIPWSFSMIKRTISSDHLIYRLYIYIHVYKQLYLVNSSSPS